MPSLSLATLQSGVAENEDEEVNGVGGGGGGGGGLTVAKDLMQ